MILCYDCIFQVAFRPVKTFEFGEIQKFSRLDEQAGESNNKFTVISTFV